MTAEDTIVAISSAVGNAARMIVRASGPDILRLATLLCPGSALEHATATRATLRIRDLRLPITLYTFRAPRSYTGEDLVEFHLPGNPLLARMLVEEIVARGARPADPGEFTARAYFNGRMDLAEAEGVAATIAASNDAELRAARQLLGGELARRLRPVMDLVAETLALVEVGIDFSDEDVTFLSAAEVAERSSRADAMLGETVDQSARFERLAHEPRAVLVGRPNAGKSTLLNALAGRERAVVSPVAGTTRDAISIDIPLARGMLRLVDVAGLDESATHAIDRGMQDTALREAASADLVLLVHDLSASDPPPALPTPPDLVILTKADLPPAPAPPITGLPVSARTGEGLAALREHLDALAFGATAPAAGLALNARHLAAIDNARAALDRVVQQVAPELLALELRESLDHLGGVLGRLSPDDLIGRIFSAFCIGK